MENLDQNILTFFDKNRIEWLSFLMLIITYSSGYMIVASVSFLSSLSFFIHNKKEKIFGLLASVLGSGLTVLFLKNIFEKSRPVSEAFYLEETFALPSGHAALSLALYGFLFLTIWQHEKHPLKNKTLIGLGLLIILVGFSRIYLGVHYLSDVLVGYLVALFWLFLVSKIKN